MLSSKRTYKYQLQFKIQKSFHDISEKWAPRVKLTGLETWKRVLLAGLTRGESTGSQTLKGRIRFKR